MESSNPAAARLHPLLSAAAISITVFAIAGVGAFTGVLPLSFGSPQPAALAAAAAPAAAPAPVAAASPLPETASAAPRPAVKAQARPAAPRPVPVAEARTPEAMPPSAPAATPAPVYTSAAPPLSLPDPAPVAQARCFDCGTVEAVREVEHKGEGSWIGPVAGGVGGAILGKQMGKGAGNTIMTVLGAAGGAYAGHEIEKRVRSTRRWEVSVRLEDGSQRTVSYDTLPAWRVGERVRYVNGSLAAEQRS